MLTDSRGQPLEVGCLVFVKSTVRVGVASINVDNNGDYLIQGRPRGGFLHWIRRDDTGVLLVENEPAEIYRLYEGE